MTHRTYLLPLVLALLLLLSLTACGDSSSDNPQSGYETVMDMEFLDGMWSIDGTSRLYFDSEEGFYAYRTGWGLGGRGEFELSEASGRPMIFFNGFLYNFLLRDDGVLLPNQNGEGSGLTIHRHTFLRDDEAEIVEWDKSNWDGMWQNALGETLLIDTARWEYIACSPEGLASGTIYDREDGRGPYLFLNGFAYPRLSQDGSSLALYVTASETQAPDGSYSGVFYRDGDAAAYADLTQSGFSEDGGRLWYYDGAEYFAVPEGYAVGQDGRAYDANGKVYAAGWESPVYDPGTDWGPDWDQSWD